MTKRILSVIISIVLMLMCIPLTSFADFETGTYRVISSNGVNIYNEISATAEIIAVARQDVCLTVLKIDNGYGRVVYDSIYGWVDLAGGLSFVRTDPYTDSQGKVEGLADIKITKEPDKKTYIDGEEKPSTKGLEVTGIFSDGSQYAITGYSVAFPSLTKPGKKVVTVYYGGFTASFFVTVERVPVASIEITSLPDKTVYKQGQKISFDGLTVIAHFNGRDDKTITDYEMTEIATDGTAEIGTYDITIKYMYDDITATFPVTVEKTSLKSLTVKKLPEKLTIYQGEKLDLSDTLLVAEYDNGTVIEASDFDADYDNKTVGTNTAKLYFDGKYVAFDFEVLELIETGIEIIPPKNAKTVKGIATDFSDLKVFVTYNNGKKAELSREKYTIDGLKDFDTVGSFKITVKYGEYSQIFEFEITERLFGDVNFNSKIDTADARLILKYSAKLITLDKDALYLADVNNDTNVNVKDARIILRVIAKLDTITRTE